jgi:hypothetical protein
MLVAHVGSNEVVGPEDYSFKSAEAAKVQRE